MSNTPIYDESRNGVDHVRLPYQLTAGVTATREGLEIVGLALVIWLFPDAPEIKGDSNGWLVPWPDVAYRLRYREGEPWCHADPWDDDILCGNTAGEEGPDVETGIALHRLAAILCDDAEAFRVLYWCIHNLRASDE